jgi:hypothetical protein
MSPSSYVLDYNISDGTTIHLVPRDAPLATSGQWTSIGMLVCSSRETVADSLDHPSEVPTPKAFVWTYSKPPPSPHTAPHQGCIRPSPFRVPFPLLLSIRQPPLPRHDSTPRPMRHSLSCVPPPSPPSPDPRPGPSLRPRPRPGRAKAPRVHPDRDIHRGRTGGHTRRLRFRRRPGASSLVDITWGSCENAPTLPLPSNINHPECVR